MSVDSKDQGFLSRWSKRKQTAREADPDSVPKTKAPLAADPVAEPDTDEAAFEVLRERDPELAEQISGIDIDRLTYDDDFSVFMNEKVPEFIRRKALSKLWSSNPVLANVDGLNDYDEDFTDAGSVVEAIQTAFSKDDENAAAPSHEGASVDDGAPVEEEASDDGDAGEPQGEDRKVDAPQDEADKGQPTDQKPQHS